MKEKLSEKIGTKSNGYLETPCDLKWPICAVALEKNKKTREEIDIWTFREGRPPRLDHNYLLKLEKKSVKVKPIWPEKNFKKVRT